MARRANVGDIVKVLTGSSSRGVLIVGSHGAGKTWMLGQIRAALGADAVTIRLSASKALATIPFGAVNARVGSSLVRSNDHYTVLNGLLEEVHKGLGTADHVFLMVDNAEYLDGESAAIISQVVMSTESKLILVDRLGGHETHLRELWRDGHLKRFELAPLQSADVQVFLENFLDGKVTGPTAHYLARRSGGNPLVLQGLVRGAQEEGSLRTVNGIWVLDHPGDKLGTESWQILQMDLEHLRPEPKRLIEILALAGSLPLDVLLDLTSAEAIDDIQQRELVEILPGQDLSMRLARAVTAPVIRSTIPVGRSRKYFMEVARLLPMEEQKNPESIINFTRWSRDCGMPVSNDRLLKAAVCANQLMRPLDAVEFSSNKTNAKHSPALLAERAIATMNQNKTQEARVLADQALAMAAKPEEAVRALQAVHLSYFSDVDYPNQMNAAFAAYDARFGAPVLDDSATRADIDVMMIRAMKEVSTGEIGEAKLRIEGLRAHPLTGNVGDRVQLKSLHSEILSATGKLQSAVALATEVIADLESPAGFPRPDISILAYSRSVAAFIYDGEWDYVSAALDPDIFVNPDLMLYSGGLRDLAAAMTACRRGNIEAVLSALEPAVGALGDYDPWSVLPAALGIRAYGQVMTGDIAASQESLAQLAALDQRSGKFYELEGAAYAAAAQCMTGQGELGLARLRGLQRECAAHAYLGIELTILSLLLRVGDSSAVPRLAEVAELVESSSRDFFISWANAMRSQDPAILDEASAKAMDRGFELLGAELATHAQRKFDDHGKVSKGRRTANKVVAMRERMPGLASPIFQAIDQPKMTRREHQIALLVAQGESNNSIANRLNVSLRTIEGHLYRTFIKADVQSREQLAALMNGESVTKNTDTYYS